MTVKILRTILKVKRVIGYTLVMIAGRKTRSTETIFGTKASEVLLHGVLVEAEEDGAAHGRRAREAAGSREKNDGMVVEREKRSVKPKVCRIVPKCAQPANSPPASEHI